MADCLIKMELMDKKNEEDDFLNKSGHSYIRSKKFNSMSLKEFLEVLETKFIDVASKDDPTKEFECVETFIRLVEEDRATFVERTEADIREAEMTPYERRQRKLA